MPTPRKWPLNRIGEMGIEGGEREREREKKRERFILLLRRTWAAQGLHAVVAMLVVAPTFTETISSSWLWRGSGLGILAVVAASGLLRPSALVWSGSGLGTLQQWMDNRISTVSHLVDEN
jgi:hypothetical protein